MRLLYKQPTAELKARVREAPEWQASQQERTLHGLELELEGFAGKLDSTLLALREAFPEDHRLAASLLASEIITVRDGCAILRCGLRAYASTDVSGEPWHSHVLLDDPDVDVITYARLDLLFEFRGYPLCVCTYYRPVTNFDVDGTRTTLPDVMWKQYATCLEMPDTDEPEDELQPRWEILPIAAILRPVPLFPIPLDNQLARSAPFCKYWLHAHWADTILPELRPFAQSNPHELRRLVKLTTAFALAARPNEPSEHFKAPEPKKASAQQAKKGGEHTRQDDEEPQEGLDNPTGDDAAADHDSDGWFA